jgi:hypothetical protein
LIHGAGVNARNDFGHVFATIVGETTKTVEEFQRASYRGLCRLCAVDRRQARARRRRDMRRLPPLQLIVQRAASRVQHDARGREQNAAGLGRDQIRAQHEDAAFARCATDARTRVARVHQGLERDL